MSFVTIPNGTLAHRLLPSQKTGSTTFTNLLLILGGSLFVALCAQIRIPIPFSPVPITAQTLGVLLVGSLLGSRPGMMSLLLYVLLGGIGMPFFAGGESGWQYVQGATFGYLLAFPLAAWLTGWLAERGWDRSPVTTMLSMLLGNIVIYTLGVAWLATLIGVQAALLAGLVPFILGDIVKIGLAGVALPSGWRLLGKEK